MGLTESFTSYSCSSGEKLTLNYLEKEFKQVRPRLLVAYRPRSWSRLAREQSSTSPSQQLGVGPGNPDGTYTQRVPLMEISSKVEEASVRVGDTHWPLKWIETHATVSKREAELVRAPYRCLSLCCACVCACSFACATHCVRAGYRVGRPGCVGWLRH